MREHENAKRNHPEAEDREKPEKAAADQSRSCRDATTARPWKGDFEAWENQSPPLRIDPVSTLCQSPNSLHFRHSLVFLPPSTDG